MEVSELLVNYVDLKVKHTLSVRANCILKTNSLSCKFVWLPEMSSRQLVCIRITVATSYSWNYLCAAHGLNTVTRVANAAGGWGYLCV